ncbi:MAG: hypothetical protein JW822_08060 [Spirochaetales bacterium]|nr:hypothetical protein [Spirochaetales bacterium]
MKMSPQHNQAVQQMQPGVITAEGFLGTDKRPLADIIQADEEQAARLDIEWEQLAALLRKFYKAGIQALGGTIEFLGKWNVKVDEARGLLPCPFKDGLFHKHTILVTHKPSGQQLLFSELSLHLLEKHHFLQGKGSTFRLELSELKTVLDL